ncbi:MAG: exodeoxyribonuclease III [Alphaproteobacteria bacterium]|nr:exodeoxyribonuclease III [Alphaproteobacteria bacterium]
MRIATFNVNSLNARLDHVRRVTEEIAPDVLCLQETKLEDERFPELAIRAMGYEHVAFDGQKSYNGVAMLSRFPLEDVQKNFREGEPHPDRRIIAATVQGVRIYGLYCPNGTEVGSDRFHGKLEWYRRLRAELDAHFAPGDDVLITGDFNVTPTENDAWDPFRSEGKLLCTTEEREAFQHLLDFGLTDAWRELNPFAVEFSWWDYQKMGWQRNQGLRIDHVLLTDPLLERCSAVTIHRDVRGWDKASDHAPVSVDLD